LADSLIRVVMRADHVEPEALKALLNGAACRIAAGRRRHTAQRVEAIFVRSAVDRRRRSVGWMRCPPLAGQRASPASVVAHRFAGDDVLMVGFFIQPTLSCLDARSRRMSGGWKPPCNQQE
jgi:hypothetical protein